VVYHGTSRRLNDNKFNSEFIFASDNDIIGAGYGFQRKGFSIGIDYALSNFSGEDINSFKEHIENLIKALENEIELGEDMPFYQEGDLDVKKNLMKELKKAKQEIKNRDIFKELEFNVFNIFQNVKNPLTVDAKGKYWHSIKFEGATNSTDELVKIAKDRGYDGLIVKNVVDKGAEASKNGEYAEVANDYIAFNPNQIKSATDNNGQFSSSNDNINDDYENVNSFAFFNEIIDKLQTLYGINIIPITNAELSQDRWASITGTKGVKSFIYNGNIYINTDIATVDSPVHEFLHLLFGSMKY
jgi:exonuclease VII small subunit